MTAVLILLLVSSLLVLVLLCVLLLTGGTVLTSSSWFVGPSVGFGVDMSLLKATGEIPSIVTKAGKRALEVICKGGMIHNEGSNTRIKMAPSGYFPATSSRVKFKIYFDDGFDWQEKPGHKVTGKLGGFKIGPGNASGGRYTTDGATYRLTFSKDRGARAYFYPALKKATTSDVTWSELDQKKALMDDSYIAMGVHVFAPNRVSRLRFAAGQWNQVEMFCKLNTVGKYDGVLELAINGTRLRLSDVRYRYTDIKIEYFLLDIFFGGSDTEYAPKKDTRMWYTDFEFGSS